MRLAMLLNLVESSNAENASAVKPESDPLSMARAEKVRFLLSIGLGLPQKAGVMSHLIMDINIMAVEASVCVTNGGLIILHFCVIWGEGLLKNIL